MPVPSQNKFILTIAEAIAHHEGFYATGTNPSKRNNNPGNLRNWDSSLPKDDKGFDEFPTRRAGFDALYRQVEKNIVKRELSLREFFAGKEDVYYGFAPAKDGNDPIKYAQFVEQFLEERGFYPISIDHNLNHWWNDLGGQGTIETLETNQGLVTPGISLTQNDTPVLVSLTESGEFYDETTFGIRFGKKILVSEKTLIADDGRWKIVG